ncbi:GTPase HflX [bacterium HR21]|nr:GTPase HflX [bacterium HR21]
MKHPSVPERALLVGLLHQHTTREELEDHLQELETLVRSAGAEVLAISWQQRPTPDVATFIGRGKVEELRALIEQKGITLVVFDEGLTPAQVRNLERAWNVKVLDRAGIILHIFAERARTQEAKVQVELAQLQYMLPRLSRLWTHLSKQVGGIGTRGPGETQLETDRRLIRRRIQHLQRKLEEIVAQRAQRRRRREELPRFALVGYTNAGKSTLMRALTAASVLVEDRLFATLDTTVRRFRLPGGQPALLSDTVGFLRKLPPQLIASFHSTLAEAIEADVLVHVVDVSHPSFRQHMQVVTETLRTLNIATKPTVLVFNKIDRLPADSPVLRELRSEYPEAVFISAERGINIRKLLATLQRVYEGQSEELAFVLPYTELRLLRHLRTSGQILQQEALPDGLLVRLRCPLAIGQRLRGQYASYVYPAGMLNA